MSNTIKQSKVLSAAVAIAFAVALLPTGTKAQSGGAPTNPQIVGTVTAADQIDINYAKLALSKTKNREVRDVTVVIRGFKFDPETVTVNQGDTVEWKNEDIVPHTATEGVAKPAFDSGTIQVGAMWRYVARNKGTYNYTCTLHPNMEGKLIVQ